MEAIQGHDENYKRFVSSNSESEENELEIGNINEYFLNTFLQHLKTEKTKRIQWSEKDKKQYKRNHLLYMETILIQ